MQIVETERTEMIQEARFFEGLQAESPVAGLVRNMLAALGEDTEREGLRRTPERVARMYDELLAGYRTDPVSLINDAIFSTGYEGLVLVRDVEFYSLCEHHLLPFFGRVHVAYLPDRRVLGLSKIPRIVSMFARRLQIQEQMTQEIAAFLQEVLQPRGVAVVAEGAHLCAMMRGVKQSDARMVTSVMMGAFEVDPGLRQDLLAQLGGPSRAV
jgi:GTP cyclohydrolase I